MAGGAERTLKRRIKSVQSTKKITRAMELIAASRIVKAQQRVAAARPYSERITDVIGNLARGGASSDHALLSTRETIRKVAFVVIAADRGLCGGYNGNVLRSAERELKRRVAAGQEYSLVLVGKKARDYFRFRKYTIDASFFGMSDQPTYENAREVADAVIPRFESGEVDEVLLVYTQFLSVGTQRVVERRFMPIAQETVTEAAAGTHQAEYEFEPEPDAILERLLPRYAEARLFAAMLDASASELAARQLAMKSATDNADEIIKILTRQMNRARQDSITGEIMEIVGGAEALAQSASGEVDLLRDLTHRTDLFGSHDRQLDRREHHN